MKIALFSLCLVVVATAVPLPDPEADPYLLASPALPYPLYSPFINAIKDQDTGVYTFPNGLLTHGNRNPFTHGYPLGYPYPVYPYVRTSATE